MKPKQEIVGNLPPNKGALELIYFSNAIETAVRLRLGGGGATKASQGTGAFPVLPCTPQAQILLSLAS